MTKGIKLSKKHGLNPTISICWLCGESKNEIALTGKEGEKIAKEMGREEGDMPMRTCLNTIPCKRCEELTKKGVMFIEVNQEV